MSKDISKWQQASRKVNDLRFALEEVLGDFSDEEKQSDRYKQLVDAVDIQFENALYHVANVKPRSKFRWISWQTLTVLLSSPVIFEIIKFILEAFRRLI